MILQRQDGALYYEVIDLVAPSVSDPSWIIFHHGVGASAGIWSEWVPSLVGRHRLLCFDMRGFGRSSFPPENYQWSFDGLVDDLLSLAQAVGCERFHLVGESIGGTAALHLAAKNPEKVFSVTVSNASHRGGAVQRAHEWRDVLRDRGIDGWAEMMTPLRFDRDQVPEEKWSWFKRAQSQSDPNAILELADLLIRSDLTSELEHISAPVLLLAPGQSPFVPVNVMQELHNYLPNSELRVFPEAKHGLPYSHGKACAEALADFLARNSNTKNCSEERP